MLERPAAVSPLVVPTLAREWASAAGDIRLDVKHEEAIDSAVPNGKLRGVLPLLATLQRDGATGVVNAGASHSNSHALTAYAGRIVGLPVITVVNTARSTGGTRLAERYGAGVVLAGPSHLSPLRHRARRIAEARGYAMLPWAFADALVIDAISHAVDEVPDEYDAMVVPVGGGGYAAAVFEGIRRLERDVVVYAVPSMDDADRARRRIAGLVTPDERLVVTDRPQPAETPWVSDPRYEWYAWAEADRIARRHDRVLFWSVGAPLR